MSYCLRHRILSAVMFPIVFPGCHGSPQGPEIVEVRGIVIYEGSPIEGANVIFSPVDPNRTLASQSVTDREGRFELSTYVGDGELRPGIAPGKYAVAITKFDTDSISTTHAPPKDVLPKKYGSPKTSGLTADVAKGRENSFEFALLGD
jgi:hypothetical protein